MKCTSMRYAFMWEVYTCICKMHVYEVYAAVSAHLRGTRLEMYVCKVQLACECV